MRILGVILVIIGIIALVYGGISYTRQKTVFEVGSIKATADDTKRIPLSPIAGALALVGGAALLVVDRRRV